MTGEDRANKIEALKKKIGESHEIANTCIDKSTNAECHRHNFTRVCCIHKGNRKYYEWAECQ
jgi:hypothetical protein